MVADTILVVLQSQSQIIPQKIEQGVLIPIFPCFRVYSNLIAGSQSSYLFPFASTNSVQFIVPFAVESVGLSITCGYEPVRIEKLYCSSATNVNGTEKWIYDHSAS